MSALVVVDSKKCTGTSDTSIVTGIDDTYSVYMVSVKSLATNYNSGLNFRVTKSGSPHTSSEYEYFGQATNSANSSAYAQYNSANSYARLVNNTNGSNAYNHGEFSVELYLYNFNNSSGYDFIFQKGVGESNDQKCWGMPSHYTVVKNASASDGIQLLDNSGNNLFCVMTLYGLKG